MKKVLYFAALSLLTTFTACEKEDIENTATVNMAGQWYVTIDAVDAEGKPITQAADGSANSGEDYFGTGKVLLLTYNTAANSSTEMWLDNLGVGNFAAKYASYGYYPSYTIKTRVKIDQNALTFSSVESENFGDGYEWWSLQNKTDESGNPILDGEGNPEQEEVMDHEEKAMPVTIEGKILPMAGTQNNGSKADSIIFFVTYKDDPWYPADGYTKYKVSGIRYSGLVEND
jgi:hypothetical protein